MKQFNKPKKFGKSPGGKKGKDFGKSHSRYEYKTDRHDFDKPRRRGAETVMYAAVCANCGQDCEVPFRPTGNRPVLCRDCFRQNEGEASDFKRDNYGSRRKPRDKFEPKHGNTDFAEELDNINRKLDRIMEALELDE